MPTQHQAERGGLVDADPALVAALERIFAATVPLGRKEAVTARIVGGMLEHDRTAHVRSRGRF